MKNPATDSFVQEARDLLEGLEAMLLALETDGSAEQVDAVFRSLHTVKGSSGMFGYTVLARFTHHFENAFDLVREGRLMADRALINLSLRARDHMLMLLETGGDGPAAEAIERSDASNRLISDIKALTAGSDTGAANATPAATPPQSAKTRTYHIWFKPNADALRNGMRPDLLIAELKELGECRVEIDADTLPPLDQLDATTSYIGFHITLTTDQPRSTVEAVFIFADDAELRIAEVVAGAAEPSDDTQSAVALADATTRTGLHEPPKPARSEDQSPRKPEASGESVRVPAVRLDDMMDQLGELVIAYARLEQIATRIGDPLLEGVVEEVERLVTGLRDATLSIRMLPIEIVFGKFRRVVRDLSVELGKDVSLIVSGGETEIDKNVIDRLTEPLVHMIRNAIDHGVESPENRLAAGKPARAIVKLSARQEGGEVLIAIEDDGAGINTEAVRAKAIRLGLIKEKVDHSEADLHNLIFAPGFSTAETVSSVSGRGVGMDAVQTAIAALRGAVDLASRRGRGTRITLRLPVTMAIIDGLLVRLGTSVFVIPLASVEECVELETADRTRESGRTMLQLREHLVPFLDLEAVFQGPLSTEARRRVVIVQSEGTRIGLVVDDILGQNQTVIKPLSPFHRGVHGFAGATILGDGSVALIVDVATLMKRASQGDSRFLLRRASDRPLHLIQPAA